MQVDFISLDSTLQILLQVFGETTLNLLMALGHEGWSLARREIQKLLSKDEVLFMLFQESRIQAVHLGMRLRATANWTYSSITCITMYMYYTCTCFTCNSPFYVTTKN